ncbi:hypothetical protein FNF31_02878 [Cafeteria roenbergensis]|uniref:GYF domain-containing protein n=2 Tax=Cafeteria roenbergensis TaxID=33653 RepID=A0A5A8DFU1_CAFRO|nr:hypothetical protein FNF31_02878 [Cafeteria roenbergensis]KAA0165927.1 hypothetical protein FNF28_03309 [Cafeteria roenbergensis]
MACTELLEPGVARRVYLAVTPFTVIAIAAHPTELGRGSLVWERSLAQLSFATVQALGGEMAVPAAKPREGIGRGFAGALAARLRGRPRALEADSQAAEAAAAAAAPGAVGVLLAFSAETATSSVLLRVSRSAAGGAAVGLRSGPLQKRPAGLTAKDWRQRHCWLGRGGLSYSAKEGGRLKGTISLHAPWVEVGPTTVASADEDCERDLTVRTPTSFHEFRAASAEDRDLWLSALRARASIAAAEVSASITLVCGSQHDAERLAAAIESHRDALTLAPLEGFRDSVHARDASDAADSAPASPHDDASLALALQLQLGGADTLPAGGLAPAPSVPAATGAPAGPGSAAWPKYDPEQPIMWSFIDDFGREQGPFPDQQMRGWLSAGYFGPDTLVLCRSTDVPGVDNVDTAPSASLAAAAAAAALPGDLSKPTAHLPLFALFPDPSEAFCGGLGWVDTFNSTMRFQALLTQAADLGVDPASAANAAAVLRERGEPASMDSLLDMIHAQRSPDRRMPTAGPGAPPELELPAASDGLGGAASE